MTERLYYQDPELLRFEARLVRMEQLEHGGRLRWAAILDRTAFYPEGGGQPSDRGSLGGVPLEDAQDREGVVLHFLSGPIAAEAGSPVSGEVDAARRDDFRRQHTGQHILSAALLTAAGARTVSANLGEELTTVEVDAAALGESAIAAAEELANRIVNRNHPVLLHWVSPEEAARFPLRKPPPPGRERLRIVEIPGVDASACGGLHTATTGDVGLILFVGLERIRGRVRMAWKIGGRAWRELRGRERVLAEVSAELTCGIEAIPASIRALKGRLKGQELALEAAEKGLAALEAGRLIAGAAGGGVRMVCHRLEAASAGMLSALILALVANPRTVACLGGPLAEGSMPWVVGCSEDLDVRLEQVLPPLLPLVEGRGGGRGRRWQGSARRPQGWPELCAALAGKLGATTGGCEP